MTQCQLVGKHTQHTRLQGRRAGRQRLMVRQPRRRMWIGRHACKYQGKHQEGRQTQNNYTKGPQTSKGEFPDLILTDPPLHIHLSISGTHNLQMEANEKIKLLIRLTCSARRFGHSRTACWWNIKLFNKDNFFERIWSHLVLILWGRNLVKSGKCPWSSWYKRKEENTGK